MASTWRQPPDGILSQVPTYCAAIAAGFIGSLGVSFSPFVLSALSEQAHIDVRTASFLVSGEFAAFLVAALAVSNRRALTGPKLIAMAAAAYGIGSLGSAFSDNLVTLAIARVFCGVGGGIAMAGATRLMAQHRLYGRLFAVALSGSALLTVIALAIIPALLEHAGASSAYLALATIGCIAAPVILLFRVDDHPNRAAPPEGKVWLIGFAVLITAYFLSRLNDSTIWSYSEKLAERVGIGTDSMGLVLAGATLIAMTAPFLAMRPAILRHFGMVLIAMLMIKAIQSLMMLYAPSETLFIVAQFVAMFSFVFITQMFMTHFSALDSSGKLAAFCSTLGMTGDAVGPALSGEFFARQNLAGVANLSFGIGLLGAAVAFAAIRRKRGRA
jgi:MFS family permease